MIVDFSWRLFLSRPLVRRLPKWFLWFCFSLSLVSSPLFSSLIFAYLRFPSLPVLSLLFSSLLFSSLLVSSPLLFSPPPSPSPSPSPSLSLSIQFPFSLPPFLCFLHHGLPSSFIDCFLLCFLDFFAPFLTVQLVLPTFVGPLHFLSMLFSESLHLTFQWMPSTHQSLMSFKR